MERVTVINEKRRRRLKPKDESRSVKKKWVSPAVTWCQCGLAFQKDSNYSKNLLERKALSFIKDSKFWAKCLCFHHDDPRVAAVPESLSLLHSYLCM